MPQVDLGPYPTGQDDQHHLSDEVYQRRESAKGSKPARARRLENWTLLEDGTLLTAPGTRPGVEESADLRAAVSWAGLLLVQIGTELHRVTDLDPWATVLVAEGLEDPARFCPWDDQTLFWMAGAVRGRVDADGTPAHWGLALPPLPGLSTEAGTTPAGRYLVTWRYYDADGRVSGAPEAQAQLLDGDHDLILTHPGAAPVGAVGVEVFVSGADQETLMYHGPVDLEDLPVTLSLATVPAVPDPLDTLLLDPPPVGEGMCPFGNVLLIWSGDTLYPSQPRDPSLWDWQEGTQFDDPIRQVLEVADGAYVATLGGLYFLPAADAGAWQIRQINSKPHAAGGLAVPGDLLGLDTPSPVALLADADGLVYGLPSGQVVHPMAGRVGWEITSATRLEVAVREADGVTQVLIAL